MALEHPPCLSHLHVGCQDICLCPCIDLVSPNNRGEMFFFSLHRQYNMVYPCSGWHQKFWDMKFPKVGLYFEPK